MGILGKVGCPGYVAWVAVVILCCVGCCCYVVLDVMVILCFIGNQSQLPVLDLELGAHYSYCYWF